jgi:hypothetical protein
LPERFRVDCAFGGGAAALSHSRRNYSSQAARLASPSSLPQSYARQAAIAGRTHGEDAAASRDACRFFLHISCTDGFRKNQRYEFMQKVIFGTYFAYKILSQVLSTGKEKGPILTSWKSRLASPFKNPSSASLWQWQMTEVKECPMNVFRNKTKLALSVLAIAASAGVQAAPLTNVSIAGGQCQTWLPVAPGVVGGGNDCGATNVAAALGGVGNVELGKLASNPATTLTGLDQFNRTIVLSSLVAADWTPALAASYITDALGSVNLFLNPMQLAAAVGAMLQPQFYGRVSDPNVSFVDVSAAGDVVVGLDGFLNATPILLGLVGAVNAVLPGTANDIDPDDIPDDAQVSEIVKVQIDGATPYYQYYFTADPTGYVSNDNTNSYDGVYPFQIPEPESLALFGIGLVGLFLGRRRRL